MSCIIRISNNNKIIIYLILLISMVYGLLEYIGFPHFIVFSIDLLNIILLIKLVYNRRIFSCKSMLLKTQCLVLFIGMVVAIFNFVPPFQIAWALRNYGRFIVFYIACNVYLDSSDEKIFWRLMYRLYYINFIVMIIEFFLLRIKGDDLGGIFGSTGSNSSLNIFIMMVVCHSISLWMLEKYKMKKMILILGIAVIEAIIAELKFVFIEIGLITILSILLSFYLGKKIKLILKIVGLGTFLSVIMGISISILYKLYPIFNNFFSVEYILYEISRPGGYTNSGDINRLTAFSTINNLIFENYIPKMLFGIGLGYGEFSDGLSFVTGIFYKNYEYLHYQWFSHAWMYIENGAIGVFLYCFGFFKEGLYGLKKLKRNYYITKKILPVVIISFLSILLFVYNQSLRLESAYMLYFCLSLVPIITKHKGDIVKNEI